MGTAQLGLLASLAVLQQVTSWSVKMPSTVTAVEGSCVLVPCQTQPHSRVIWYRYRKIGYPVVYDGVRPQSVESQFIGRTSVLGKAAKGNCSLLIENVKKTDNKVQVYVQIKPEAKGSQNFYEQTVTILVERNSPVISTEGPMVEGRSFLANCTITHSCPAAPPSLHWHMSRPVGNFTLTDSTEDVRGRWRLTQTLLAVANHKMHNSKVRCSAKFRSHTTNSSVITLNVLYAPVILPTSSCNHTAGALRCSCRVAASPTASINWVVDGNYTLHSSLVFVLTKEKELLTEEISVPDGSQISVWCEAKNSLGNDTKQLYVSNSWNFKSLSLLVGWMLAGSVLVLGCAMFIYRKYPQKRLKNIDINIEPINIEPIHARYTDSASLHSEDLQPGPAGPETDPEEDRASATYDNEFLQEMQTLAATQQSKVEATLMEKDESFDNCVYLNY